MVGLPDRSIRISIDRGGTFTDCYASFPDSEDSSKRKELVVKLLSQDPNNYKDAPTEGIRRILERLTGDTIPRGAIIDTAKIDCIRLSTTVATNALLERKGSKHAFVVTKGFKDLLRIGNQSRPKIFDLNIQRPDPLYSQVIEVDERVTLVGYQVDPQAKEHAIVFDQEGKVQKTYSGRDFDSSQKYDIVQGLSGEAVQIIKRPDEAAVTQNLQELYDQGFRSLAICLIHSFTYPDHELLVGKLASEIGFTQISLSSQLLSMIKAVPRGASAVADAYLTPVLQDYLDGFFAGFDKSLRSGGKDTARVEYMSSDGGLVDVADFSGLKSLLSGPAGGVVGYALTSYDKDRKYPVIGLDIGGTSTDVSRYDGSYEVVYETSTAGIPVYCPQLDINTVAAGGGSCLTFQNGLFRSGPDSAGADPGPACYQKKGPLALTDANLCLGRLVVNSFPSIFGPNEDQPLDEKASRDAFLNMQKQIEGETGQAIDFDEMVYGFVRVANETMTRPIRALTEARGYSPAKHVLSTFGGAGGQHACEIASVLGISKVLVHRHASILSAYGLALADRTVALQEPCATAWSQKNMQGVIKRLDTLAQKASTQLQNQGFTQDNVHVETFLNMRFSGSDTALMTRVDVEDSHDDVLKIFKDRYLEEFGFLLENRDVIIDDFKVVAIGKTAHAHQESVFAEIKRLERQSTAKEQPLSTQKVYFHGRGRVDTPVYELSRLRPGQEVAGPALIIDATTVVVIIPGAQALTTSQALYIELQRGDL